MENKYTEQSSYNLVVKLLDEVNSKEEFDYLLGEKVRLWSLISPDFSFQIELKGGMRKDGNRKQSRRRDW